MFRRFGWRNAGRLASRLNAAFSNQPRFSGMRTQIGPMVLPPKAPPDIHRIGSYWGVITSHTQISQYQWEYQHREVRKTTPGLVKPTWRLDDAARFGKAWNLLEVINGEGTLMGNGYSLDDFPGTPRLGPCPVGNPLLFMLFRLSTDESQAEPWFLFPNPVLVECPEE